MAESDPRWDAAVRQHLDEWGIEALSVELVSLSENFVYRVRSRDDDFAVRVHRPGYHRADELVAEHEWLIALRAAGCPVPEPVSTRAAMPFSQVAVDAEAPRFVTVVRWVDGDLAGMRLQRSDADERTSLLAEMGQTMASLHAATEQWRLPDGFDRVAWDAAGLLGDDPVWGRFWETRGLTSGESAQLLLARDLAREALPDRRSEYGLIHADLHPFNVVSSVNGLHVIDFDDAGFGWHAYDIAIALYNFREEAGYARLRDAFLDGYASLRHLPSPLDLDLFMAIRSLVWLGWVADRPDLFAGARHERALRRVLDDANRLVAARR